MIPSHHYGPNMPPAPQSGSFLAPPNHLPQPHHAQIPYSFYPENTPALSHQYAYAPPHYI